MTPNMRYTQLFMQTLRDTPAEAEAISHRLALRAGLVRPLAAGVFSFLPLGMRVKQKIETILREEMVRVGCAELLMPLLQPAELWEETGRWNDVGPEMMRMTDRNGRDMCLAMTHEEAVTDLARNLIQSYRQLPLAVFHIQTKFRDEPRSRGGLIRVREFTMKDAYSFHLDQNSLDEYYPRMYAAYERIFARVGLGDTVIAVESDTGMMGGTEAHEFMYLNPAGEDTLLLCDGCGYRANRQVARFQRQEAQPETAQPLEAIPTPNCTTIAELADFLQIPESRTAKAVFFIGTIAAGERFVFAVIRGDHDLNETKLANAVGATELRPATEDEIRAIGAEPGYGSPIGVKDNVLVVVDEAVAGAPNLVSGANREGYHCRNVNAGRDYQPDLVTDLVAVASGMPCLRCGAPLRSARGIEVGNIFKLGTKYSVSMGATVQDEAGNERPMITASYGIGVGRLLACVIEAHHDDHGIVWPLSIAPFQAHVVLLRGKADTGEQAVAEELYTALQNAGIETLLDDRDERPGVKFNDADLIGIPLRITVGPRGLANGVVEVKRRNSDQRQEVEHTHLVSHVQAEIAALTSASQKTGE